MQKISNRKKEPQMIDNKGQNLNDIVDSPAILN